MCSFFYCRPEFEIFDLSFVGAGPLLFSQLVDEIHLSIRSRDVCDVVAEYMCGPTDFRTLFNAPLFRQNYYEHSAHRIPTLVDSTLLLMLLRCDGDLDHAFGCLQKLLFVRGMQDSEDTYSRDIFEHYYSSPDVPPRLSARGALFMSMYQPFGERMERELRFFRLVSEGEEEFYKYVADDFKRMLIEAGSCYNDVHDIYFSDSE
jgi:hypothetical protein